MPQTHTLSNFDRLTIRAAFSPTKRWPRCHQEVVQLSADAVVSRVLPDFDAADPRSVQWDNRHRGEVG